jgi:hypothetical protein
LILVAAYQQCLHGNDHPDPVDQQTALRCAASVYNTGDERAGILNGYQSDVWRTAAQIVPAIQLAGGGPILSPPVTPEKAVVPESVRPSPGLEDALHVAPLVLDGGDGLSDALHPTDRKDHVP